MVKYKIRFYRCLVNYLINWLSDKIFWEAFINVHPKVTVIFWILLVIYLNKNRATYKIERGNRVDIIYNDFSKAFDKVPRRKLLSKLKAYRNEWKVLILLDWEQWNIFGNYSNWYPKVLQGSALGQILFAMNKIKLVRPHFENAVSSWIQIQTSKKVKNLRQKLYEMRLKAIEIKKIVEKERTWFKCTRKSMVLRPNWWTILIIQKT